MKTVRARAAGARRRLAARVHRVIQTRKVTGAKPGRAYKSPKESREAFSRWSGCLVDLTVDRLRRARDRPPRAEHLADGFHVRLDVGERLDAPKRHLRLERELAVAVPEEGGRRSRWSSVGQRREINHLPGGRSFGEGQASSRLPLRRVRSSDHLIGAKQNRLRDRNPERLGVFRFTTSLSIEICSTGRSDALAPFSRRSTKYPARTKLSYVREPYESRHPASTSTSTSVMSLDLTRERAWRPGSMHVEHGRTT